MERAPFGALTISGAGNGTRTRECQLGKLMPYHLAMPACESRFYHTLPRGTAAPPGVHAMRTSESKPLGSAISLLARPLDRSFALPCAAAASKAGNRPVSCIFNQAGGAGPCAAAMGVRTSAAQICRVGAAVALLSVSAMVTVAARTRPLHTSRRSCSPCFLPFSAGGARSPRWGSTCSWARSGSPYSRGSRGGVGQLIGPTGGFLWGFLLGTALGAPGSSPSRATRVRPPRHMCRGDARHLLCAWDGAARRLPLRLTSCGGALDSRSLRAPRHHQARRWGGHGAAREARSQRTVGPDERLGPAWRRTHGGRTSRTIGALRSIMRLHSKWGHRTVRKKSLFAPLGSFPSVSETLRVTERNVPPGIV